jgi:hypothetical protein
MAAKDPNKSVFQRIRSELAALLRIDPDNASFAQRLRLDRAIALKLEIDRQQSAQMAGQAVDISRLTAAAEQRSLVSKKEPENEPSPAAAAAEEPVQPLNV